MSQTSFGTVIRGPVLHWSPKGKRGGAQSSRFDTYYSSNLTLEESELSKELRHWNC
jgi:hypothetical protein